MIGNRLKIILATKDLTAHQVFLDTQIAKSTLSAIVNNRTEKMSMEVLDKLCTYLQISPGDFFEFIPYEIDTEIKGDISDLEIYLIFNNGKKVIVKYRISNIQSVPSFSGMENDGEVKANELEITFDEMQQDAKEKKSFLAEISPRMQGEIMMILRTKISDYFTNKEEEVLPRVRQLY